MRRRYRSKVGLAESSEQMHFESTKLNCMVKVGFPATPTAERTLFCPDLSAWDSISTSRHEWNCEGMIYSSEFEDELGHIEKGNGRWMRYLFSSPWESAWSVRCADPQRHESPALGMTRQPVWTRPSGLRRFHSYAMALFIWDVQYYWYWLESWGSFF